MTINNLEARCYMWDNYAEYNAWLAYKWMYEPFNGFNVTEIRHARNRNYKRKNNRK